MTTGPFANWTVRFGPIGPSLTDSMRNNLIKYKPHCLSRSFKPNSRPFHSPSSPLAPSYKAQISSNVIFIIDPIIPTILNLHGKDHQSMSFIYSINKNSQLPHIVNFFCFFLTKKKRNKILILFWNNNIAIGGEIQ